MLIDNFRHWICGANEVAELGRGNQIKLFSYPTTMDRYFTDEWLVEWIETLKNAGHINWLRITQNPNVTAEFAMKHLEYLWDFVELNRKPDLTLEMMNSLPDKHWSIRKFYRFGKITVENLGENPTEHVRAFELSNNTNLTLDIIKKFPDIEWDWGCVAQHSKITMDTIFANYPKIIKNIPYNCWLCENLEINIKTVVKNKHSDFLHWSVLSQHKNITLGMIMKNRDLPWEWDWVGANPNVTMEMVLDNPEIKWDYIGKNPNFTIDMVQKFPQHKWNWSDIARNPNISMKDIFDHVDFNATETQEFWDGIVYNPNITMDVILENHDVLHWERSSYNDGLWLYEVLKNEKMPWDWDCICRNTFDRSKSFYVNCCYEQLLVMALHEFYEDNCRLEMEMLERVLFDSYLVKMVCKY